MRNGKRNLGLSRSINKRVKRSGNRTRRQNDRHFIQEDL